MAKLTLEQTIQDAMQAGFTGSGLTDIVAIAEAESGLETTAHNPGNASDPENSYGIVQINLLAHPEVSVSQAEDPLQALKYAFKLSQGGTNFTPWSTFTNGAYRQYLSNITTNVTPNPGPGNPISGIVDGVSNGVSPVVGGIIGSIFGSLGIPSLKDLGYRSLFIGVGIIMMLIGLFLFALPAAQQTAPLALGIAGAAA